MTHQIKKWAEGHPGCPWPIDTTIVARIHNTTPYIVSRAMSLVQRSDVVLSDAIRVGKHNWRFVCVGQALKPEQHTL